MVPFFSGARAGGWGFVIRNYNGEMLAAGDRNIVFAASALQTEALAAYKSLQHASQLGMMNIILETDAAVLASALKSEDIDGSPIGSLTKQIRDLMQSEFKLLCSLTVVADCLATHGACVLGSGSCVFMSQAPEFVTKLLYGDLPGSSAYNAFK
jgi:ribonuclease HI